MAHLHGGRNNITFTEKDMRNSKAEYARKEEKMMWPNCLTSSMSGRAKTVDDNNIVKNIFWSHASQCAEFKDFGDVMTFDTIHKTNKNKMPLVLFVGFNHQLLRLQESSKEPCRGSVGGTSLGLGNMNWKTVQGARDKNLQEKIEALINWPLQPTEFEAAWTQTVTELGIQEHPAIVALWSKRSMFIACYFKANYYGRMTSTQRSESTNNMLKLGFVNNATSMNMLAKQCFQAIQHVDHLAPCETHYSEAPNMRASYTKLDEQFDRAYIRKVYQDYKYKLINSTAFRIDPHPSKENTYLVRHEKGTGNFYWAKHAFVVKADVANDHYACECLEWEHTAFRIDPHPSKENTYLVRHEKGTRNFYWAKHAFVVKADVANDHYACECLEWEHTGLFCHHLLRASTHLQVTKLPSTYILKRYTRNAVSNISCRDDDSTPTTSELTNQTRYAKLLPELMGLAREACTSDDSYTGTMTECNTNLVHATEQQQLGQANVRPELQNISISAPPVAKTNGSKPNKEKKTLESQSKQTTSTNKRKKPNSKGGKTFNCTYCGKQNDHYSTTCALDPNRSCAAEKKLSYKTVKYIDKKKEKGKTKSYKDGRGRR
ncbi:hypothetical protein U9M48_013766 [Paspalum notatum var. saurae]|uniref:Protein FAR1-RELATED SEQUENCE n=1 Tax=Paspalum notatum var. saurae TaxID=547442 RepID=A0AAQ3T129_PASNO